MCIYEVLWAKSWGKAEHQSNNDTLNDCYTGYSIGGQGSHETLHGVYYVSTFSI